MKSKTAVLYLDSIDLRLEFKRNGSKKRRIKILGIKGHAEVKK